MNHLMLCRTVFPDAYRYHFPRMGNFMCSTLQQGKPICNKSETYLSEITLTDIQTV